MKNETEKPSAPAEPILTWKVAATPAGESTLKIGAVRAGRGARVNLTKAKADAVLSVLPGSLVLEGI